MFCSNFSIMEPGAVSYCSSVMARVVTHDGMLSVRIIRTLHKQLWGIRRCIQHTNIVSIGKRNLIWKRIIGIPLSFVQAGTIVNGNGREIQIWATTIN